MRLVDVVLMTQLVWMAGKSVFIIICGPRDMKNWIISQIKSEYIKCMGQMKNG